MAFLRLFQSHLLATRFGLRVLDLRKRTKADAEPTATKKDSEVEAGSASLVSAEPREVKPKQKRSRIVHDETTLHIREYVETANKWFQSEQKVMYKVMPYWNRGHVSFAVKEGRSWKEAPWRTHHIVLNELSCRMSTLSLPKVSYCSLPQGADFLLAVRTYAMLVACLV